MFDLDVSDDRVAVAGLGRGIGLDVLSPAARAAEQARVIPVDVTQTLWDTGLTVLVDEQYGGGGIASIGTHMLAIEALSYGDPGLAMAGPVPAQSWLVAVVPPSKLLRYCPLWAPTRRRQVRSPSTRVLGVHPLSRPQPFRSNPMAGGASKGKS